VKNKGKIKRFWKILREYVKYLCKKARFLQIYLFFTKVNSTFAESFALKRQDIDMR
jgi:hypothetical protein